MKSALFAFLLLFSALYSKIVVPESYPNIVEKLICFKDDRFKVFYGGPIDNSTGVKWLQPVIFESEEHAVRAVYEISYINCLPLTSETKDLEVCYLKLNDIDVKFQNESCEEYVIFSKLINNRDPNKKCILIREVDVSNIYYPDIFIEAIYSEFKEADKKTICAFLQTKFKTKKGIKELAPRDKNCRKQIVDPVSGLVEKRTVASTVEGKKAFFNVDHYYLKEDPWKSYYVVTLAGDNEDESQKEEPTLLRIDSGCNSGQVYCDQSCDCLEQLRQGLADLAATNNRKSLVIHVPAHDGRGFGQAPKAETEIYKRGGDGRVNRTGPLDTVQAAKLLYRTNDFDIRTYDGCAKILGLNKITSVQLLTDNKQKVQALQDHGISVERRKTHTMKEACLIHIMAKKNSDYYFSN